MASSQEGGRVNKRLNLFDAWSCWATCVTCDRCSFRFSKSSIAKEQNQVVVMVTSFLPFVQEGSPLWHVATNIRYSTPSGIIMFPHELPQQSRNTALHCAHIHVHAACCMHVLHDHDTAAAAVTILYLVHPHLSILALHIYKSHAPCFSL